MPLPVFSAEFDGQSSVCLAVPRLDLTQFRNYTALRLNVEPGPIVLTGSNGAGKTSLLEAVSLLAPGRGIRRAKPAQLGRFEADGCPWAVSARLITPVGEMSIGTGRDPADGPAGRRRVHVDGTAARSQADLARHLAVVWLTPDMDRLFDDGAIARRRFIDRLTVGYDPSHSGRVRTYDRVLRERSRLLRDGRRDPAWLDVLEERIAAEGVAIVAARRDMVARLDALTRDGDGPFPGAALAIEGEVEDWLDSGPALAAEDRLRQALAHSRARDTETGGASHGPHRSELHAHHLATARPASLCSTGEQKALLISIVLAHARLLTQVRGAPPVLLLDEVAAHLDEVRRWALFERLTRLGIQVWLTGTDESLFAPLRSLARFFSVVDGTVTS